MPKLMPGFRVTLGRLALAACLAAAPGTLACAGGHSPAEYPEVKLSAMALELNIQDPRTEFYETVTEPSDETELGEERFAQRLPETFEQKAIQRLEKICSNDGPTLKVEATVKKADAIFRVEQVGKFVRYEVKLSFKVTTESGALLDRGSGTAWQEIPEREMNEANLAKTYEATALEALDNYFADEDVLEKINSQLQRYLAANPDKQ